jgi:hypothetical protein
MTKFAGFSGLLWMLLVAMPPLAHAQGNGLHIELNRLEERGAGCRVHLVLENASPQAYTSYRLDLVIFGTNGVIARRLALESAPLRARKTMVKEFELTDFSCKQIGRILLNDISRCTSAVGDMDDCISTTRVSSRGSVEFLK